MPNPKKKIDCIILADTYSLLDFSTPLELAREVAGGKFTTPEYNMMLGEGIEKTNNKFDISGEYGEYIVYPGAFGFNMREKCLANSEEQKNLYKKHSKILVNELDELAASENLKDYPALKGFVEYRNKFLKAAIEGTDRLAVLAETPGGYSLRASPDWTQNKKGHEKNAKQFNDMFIGMKYDKLFAITDEYIDLELEMRNKVLTPEKLKECKDKRIDQNNRMIKIYEHQKAPESKEKYWEFFQNYDDTIGGSRGVSETIRQLKSHNQALENGWDVSRLYMFSHMEEIATDCRKAQETFAHFNDPNLDKVSVYSKKVAKLDPTNRNFENMEQFDKYMTEFHLAFTDLINEVSKPEVHEALSNVESTITLKTFEYNQSMAKRQYEIQIHKGDSSYSAPPEPKKPDVYNLESGFFHDFGSDVNGIVFRRLREFAKCVDPEYYDLEGDKKAVEQRKTEIATAKAPLMAKKGREITAGSNLNKLLEVNKKKTDEVAKAQEYIDCTLKASKLASEKLKALPPY